MIVFGGGFAGDVTLDFLWYKILCHGLGLSRLEMYVICRKKKKKKKKKIYIYIFIAISP